MRTVIVFLTLILTKNIVFSQPVITSFSPASGPIGTTVNISGNNFSPLPSSNIVFFGAVKAAVLNASVASLTVIVPLAATFQPITVTVNGLTSGAKKPFIVTFPGGLPIFQTPDFSQNSFELTGEGITGLHPNGVAISDFDGDGKPDLATPNNYSIAGQPASISILKNIGNTGVILFGTKQDIPTGLLTYAIAAGDLDGDGKPDLISTSIVDKTISVFKNTSTLGNITFASKVDYATGNNPYSIAIVDFDNDGNPDLAVSNFFSNSVSVFRNTSTVGKISFALKTDFFTAFGPRFVVGGDLDGDGKADLAVTNEQSNSISVFRNTSIPGSISFTAKVDFLTGGNPFGTALADIDGDGKPDLVTANNSTNNYSVIRNTSSPGSLAFAIKKDYACGASPFNVSIDDLNGDGKPEVVVASYNVTVSQNNSTPGFVSLADKTFLFYSPTSFMVSIGDLDGDGKADLAGAGFSSNKVLLIRNKNNEPTIKTFTPASAISGTTIIINGYDFTGVTAVSFGGVAAASFTVVNSTTISAVVGPGASGNVAVTNQYGTHKKGGYTFLAAPIITSFTPTSGATSDLITIRGTQFGTATAVNFGGTPALQFYVIDDTTIMARIENGASGSVTVTTAYGSGSLAGFTYIPPPPPTITSFTPNVAGTGETVTINGTNFIGTTSVNFGNVPAQSFIVASPTKINAIVGPGFSGDVSVTTADGSTTLGGFTYVAPPVINSFTPTSGQAGNIITITGSNFIAVTSISFGGVAASSFIVVSPTIITAVPDVGNTGIVSVTTLYGTGTLDGFIYNYPPTVTNLENWYGGMGDTITIFGTYLTGATNVTFGGVNAASFVVNSPTQITAILGAGATGNIAVTTPYGTAMVGTFIYKYPPTITSFSPTSGGNGTIIDITGNGFEYYTGTSVSFGGVPATSVAWISPTHIRAEVGTGASGSISVATLYGTASGSGFTWVSAPTISSFSESSAGAGTPITIIGINFDNAISVSFGGAQASSFIVLSSTTISAVVGLGSSGLISVTTPGGTATASGFMFINSTPPTISSFTPTAGPAGTSVVISGSNFNPAISFNTVYFGAVKAVVTAASPGSLTVTAPAGANYQPVTVTSNHLTAYASKPYTNTFSGGSGFTQNSFAQKIDSLVGDQYYSASSIVSTDLDADNKPDIILVAGVGLLVYRNTGSLGNISFAPRMYIERNSYSNNMAVGDLDGDGKQDIVYSSNNDSITVLRNTSTNGNISFTRKRFYMLKQSYGVAIKDLDADGKPDVIASSYSDQKVCVFKNTTLGSDVNFASLAEFPLGNQPYGLMAEDLDADGKPELIIAAPRNFGDPSVSVLRNTSANNIISFAPKVDFNGGNAVKEINIGDLDGDGKPDIITTTYNGSSILRNTSSPGTILFAYKYDLPTKNTQSSGVSVGDLDGDGKADVAVGEFSFGDSVAVLKNLSVPGTFLFEPKVSYATGPNPYGITITDLDGDSKPDISAVNPDNNSTIPNTVSFLRNVVGHISICYESGSSFISNLTGLNYQWQINTGDGFVNISDNSNYTGTGTPSMQITNVSNEWNRYHFRCVVDGASSNVYSLSFVNTWLGGINNQWENPGNWSCGMVPSNVTDVVVNSGTVILNSDTSIRSLFLKAGASVIVMLNKTLAISN